MSLNYDDDILRRAKSLYGNSPTNNVETPYWETLANRRAQAEAAEVTPQEPTQLQSYANSVLDARDPKPVEPIIDPLAQPVQAESLLDQIDSVAAHIPANPMQSFVQDEPNIPRPALASTPNPSTESKEEKSDWSFSNLLPDEIAKMAKRAERKFNKGYEKSGGSVLAGGDEVLKYFGGPHLFKGLKNVTKVTGFTDAGDTIEFQKDVSSLAQNLWEGDASFDDWSNAGVSTIGLMIPVLSTKGIKGAKSLLDSKQSDEAGVLSADQKKHFANDVTKIMDDVVKTTGKTWEIGAFTPNVTNVLSKQFGVKIDDGVIHTIDKKIRRMVRATKIKKDIGLSSDQIKNMPDSIENPSAIVWDVQASKKNGPTVLYLFDVPGAESLGKLVVRINFKQHKSGNLNAVISGGKIQKQAFKDSSLYPAIEGAID